MNLGSIPSRSHHRFSQDWVPVVERVANIFVRLRGRALRISLMGSVIGTHWAFLFFECSAGISHRSPSISDQLANCDSPIRCPVSNRNLKRGRCGDSASHSFLISSSVSVRAPAFSMPPTSFLVSSRSGSTVRYPMAVPYFVACLNIASSLFAPTGPLD